MIGWYIHHVGRGHLHHAMAVAAQLTEPVTALSSLARPDGWAGEWIELTRDDDGTITDPTAHGVLHWAPRHHAGLRGRMAAVADWIATARPRAFVVDVSVEVTALARLLGAPVITFCLPGTRTDPAHRLAWELADAIVAPWPGRHRGLCIGLEPFLDKVCFTGGISRFDGRPRQQCDAARDGVVLGGFGGNATLPAPDLPGWTWTILDRDTWCPDPWPRLSTADLVVTHAGLASLADVAAAQTPAVVIAQERPFGEQRATAAALARDDVAAVASSSQPQWSRLLDEALTRGGGSWSRWSDGRGATRAASAIARIARRETSSCAS